MPVRRATAPKRGNFDLPAGDVQPATRRDGQKGIPRSVAKRRQLVSKKLSSENEQIAKKVAPQVRRLRSRGNTCRLPCPQINIVRHDQHSSPASSSSFVYWRSTAPARPASLLDRVMGAKSGDSVNIPEGKQVDGSCRRMQRTLPARPDIPRACTRRSRPRPCKPGWNFDIVRFGQTAPLRFFCSSGPSRSVLPRLQYLVGESGRVAGCERSRLPHVQVAAAAAGEGIERHAGAGRHLYGQARGGAH